MRIIITLTIIIFAACKEAPTEFFYISDGGLNYINPITPLDSINYCLPLKDSFSRGTIKYTYDFYRAFDEPNLSHNGKENPIFRFTLDGFGEKPTIITFTQQKIICKIYESGLIYPDTDPDRLTEIERLHLKVLEWNLGFTYGKIAKANKQLFDSMTKSNPLLKDRNYYNTLHRKIVIKGNPFNYRTIVKIMEPGSFWPIIQNINESGYWNMKHDQSMNKSWGAAMDGAGFGLEANYKKQYQFVYKEMEANDTTNFTRLCKYLLEVAGVSNKYHLAW